MPNTKKCPYCGGEILEEARKCKHCKKWIVDEAAETIQLLPNVDLTTTDDGSTDSSKVSDTPVVTLDCNTETPIIPQSDNSIVVARKTVYGLVVAMTIIIVLGIIILAIPRQYIIELLELL